MLRKEQIEFVTDLLEIVRNEIISHINRGSMPDTFDGHELRVLISDKFKDAARLSELRRHPHGTRNREYRNWVATTPGI